jgi:hypothetical protein
MYFSIYAHLDEQSFKYLFQALGRPHIEYAEAVWSPFKVGDIDLHEARVTISTPMTINVLKYAAVDRATFLIVCLCCPSVRIGL